MPENIATGSSANYNYASVQKDNQHWDNHRQIERQKIETVDLIPAFNHFLALAASLDPKLSPILKGRVSPVIPTFHWKEEPHADPVKQVSAWKMLVDMRVLSLSDVMMLCGKNPDSQKLIVKEDIDEMEDYLIQTDIPASAMETTDNHDIKKPIGSIDTLVKTDTELRAEGPVTHDHMPYGAVEVIAAKKGFKHRPSVTVYNPTDARNVVRVGHGERRFINGRLQDGPFFAVYNGDLRNISLESTPGDRDSDTRGSILAQAKGIEPMPNKTAN